MRWNELEWAEECLLCAIASWSAPALRRFRLVGNTIKSARGLAQSKTWRKVPVLGGEVL